MNWPRNWRRKAMNIYKLKNSHIHKMNTDNFIKSYDGSQINSILMNWCEDGMKDENEDNRNKIANEYLLHPKVINKILIHDLYTEHVKLACKIWDPVLDGSALGQRLLEETGTEYLEDFLKGFESFDLNQKFYSPSFTLKNSLVKDCIDKMFNLKNKMFQNKKENLFAQGMNLFKHLLSKTT